MAGDNRSPTSIAFGDYRLSLSSFELRKHGLKVRLRQQPARVLAALAGKSGEIVKREELQRELWKDHTFVDFESGLNNCIKQIRAALNDDLGEPKYVETIPRVGYRFLAPVQAEIAEPPRAYPFAATVHRELEEDTQSQSPALKDVIPSRIEPLLRDEDPPLAPVTTGRQSTLTWHVLSPLRARAWTIGIPALLLLSGLVIGVLIWRSHDNSHRRGMDVIVLGDFTNLTGDEVFDGTLRQGLSVQLQQSPFLKLESEEQIHRTLQMMGQSTNTEMTPEIAREVCQRTDGAVSLDGSIALIGTRYDLILRAVDCVNGELLASAETQAKGKNDVLDALGRLASDMRGKLGESVRSVQRYNTPLVQATTASLEALRFYSLGERTLTQTGDFTASLAFFQRATELDPNFAMAYFALSDAYATAGESTSSARHIQKAFELRGKTSEREKLIIEGIYFYYAPGDLLKAQRSFGLLAELQPASVYAHIYLAGISNALGQFEAGLREYLEALRLAPFDSILYRHTVLTYLLLNRVEDAAAVAKGAQSNGLDSDLEPVLYTIAFYRDDTVGMARQVANAARKPGEENLLWGLEADTAAYFGHVKKARQFTHRAADSASRVGEEETAATYYAVSALREALFGNGNKARKQAATAARHSTGREMDYAVALALACAGDADRAQVLTDDLGMKFPQDTIVRLNYLPTLRAKLALSRSNPQQALAALGAAAPYELGLPALGYYNWPNLYPVYVRGEAYLASHQGEKAVVEFQKILDHRAIVLNEPISALAHLQIGRAFTLQGDKAKARAAYQDFLTLWKDADSDVPILKQAKAEYAKLQ